MKPSDGENVLLVTQFLGVGGLERMILHLATELQRRGRFRPHIVVYDQAAGQPTLHSDFSKEGIPVTVLVKGRGFSPRTARELARLTEIHHASIVHTHDLGPLIYGSVARSMAKWESRIHRLAHPFPLHIPNLFQRVSPFALVHTQHSFVHLDRKKRHRLYEKYFANRTTQLCVVSPDAAEQYRALGVKKRSIELVENGVSFSNQPPLRLGPRALLRDRLLQSIGGLGLTPGTLRDLTQKTWVLALARLHPRKGQDHLIRAWQKLSPETRSNSVLFLVGPETFRGERSRLESLLQASDGDSIFFTGSTAEPLAWLQASDGFVSASEFEGMPLGPIEALGEGLPVCLSEIAGHQILKTDATYFPLAQPAPIFERWVSGLLNETEVTRLTRWKAAETLRQRRSLSAMVDHYEAIYDQVLARRRNSK